MGRRSCRTVSQKTHCLCGYDAHRLIQCRKSLQNSVAGLRESVEIYKKEADPIELEKLNQSYQEVEALRRTATDLSTKASPKRAASTAIADFSSVALEYAKLLDVLMNQCPEYVSLAWYVNLNSFLAIQFL